MGTTSKGYSARSLLLALGMGDFNATQVIMYLFMAPAQTDPQMAQIILLTRHLQMAMVKMGVPLPVTGSIDARWASYFQRIVGPNWIDTSWADIVKTVLAKKGMRVNGGGRSLMGLGDDSGFASFEQFNAKIQAAAQQLTAAAAKAVGQGDDPQLDVTFAGSPSTTTVATSDFVSTGGVCKPKNKPALEAARKLQAQLNRIAKVRLLTPVSVDGEIGAVTLFLFRAVQGFAGQAGGDLSIADASNCLFIAGDSDVLSEAARQYADQIGAPAVAPSPPLAKPLTVIHPVTGAPVVVHQANVAGQQAALSDTLKGMSGTQQVILVGLMGGIGFMLYKKYGKGGKRSRR